MGYFGAKSEGRLNTCHPDMIMIARTVIARSRIDFSITQGARPFEQQLNYFLAGKSKLDPRRPEHLARAMHVVTEERPRALAIDIACYHPNSATRSKIVYDFSHLCYIAGLFDSVAQELYEDGHIEHVIRYGGNWDMDGVLIYDQNFQDLCHFELRKP